MSVWEKVILDVRNLKKYFIAQKSIFWEKPTYIKAVNDISFSVNSGETMGLVGESGCGKTTTGQTIIRLLEPTAGQVWFEGVDMASLNSKELVKMRRKMQMVFQDPYSSLNPRMKVKDIIGQALDIHYLVKNKKEKNERIKKLMNDVGLDVESMDHYPHEFSGGQRQRIGIARSLSVDPQLIIADEPVSALDVSVQATVINLLKDLQDEYKLTYLFIAHDLGVVKHVSDRIAVMYLGKIVEIADTDSMFANPLHPYTKALLSAIPSPDPRLKKKRIILKGGVPSLTNLPSGCNFHTRCSEAKDICSEKEPTLKEYSDNHFVSCHLTK